MRALAVIRALGPIDLRNIGRDTLMRWMFAMPLLLALAVRFGLPPVARWAETRFGFDLAPYDPLIASMLVLVTPMMFGTVIGFLLLDQKDDRTLTALQVTPLTPTQYLLYRTGAPMVLSAAMTVIVLELSGVSRVGTWGQLLAGLAAAPLAPAFALFLAAFARNKVQGFALMKAAGVINWPPAIAWFVEGDLQWLFGLCPTYWAGKLYWQLEAGEPAWLVFAAGVGYLGLLGVWMSRRFDRALHRS